MNDNCLQVPSAKTDLNQPEPRESGGNDKDAGDEASSPFYTADKIESDKTESGETGSDDETPVAFIGKRHPSKRLDIGPGKTHHT